MTAKKAAKKAPEVSLYRKDKGVQSFPKSQIKGLLASGWVALDSRASLSK